MVWKKLSVVASILTLGIFTAGSSAAQDYAKLDKTGITLDNGVVRRQIVLSRDSLTSTALSLQGDSFNFIDQTGKEKSLEFSMTVNGRFLDGGSGWKLLSSSKFQGEHGGSGARLVLQGLHALAGLRLEITYELFPGLPVIRKQIKVINTGPGELKLEGIASEKLVLAFSYVASACYTNYGREKHLGTYVGDWDDALLAVHSYNANVGVIVGDEAPGVLKRIDYNVKENELNAGLTQSGDKYPFRKYLASGSTYLVPAVFILPYVKTFDPWGVMNTTLADFQRRHMGLRIFENRHLPTFMYNTWLPFRDEYNAKLLDTVAIAASKSGIKQFVLDCGWHIDKYSRGKNVYWLNNCGDWIPDPKKFPQGLKPLFEHVRALGMEPGLWISVGSASTWAEVYRSHPEWRVIDQKGKPANLHHPEGEYLRTMCMATGFKEYSKNKILALVKELGLSYVKLDLTVLTSAYENDLSKSGCYAQGHPGHRDRAESFIAIYDALFSLFDELHKEAPDLYIDCTFETTGKLQMIDYAFCKHAEGNWLTNVEEPFPVGAYRVRDLAWWKTPAMPASSMLVGNMAMDSPNFIEELKTLLGTFPIVLGDPRKLSVQKAAEIKSWSDWMTRIEKDYSCSRFRQDLPGFGEPAERSWDGWSRVNTDQKTGGIIGVFCQGSPDRAHTVTVAGLKPERRYEVLEAPGSKKLFTLSGKTLAESGFRVGVEHAYEGKIFELRGLDE